MTKLHLFAIKSPVLAGLFFILSLFLTACQNPKSADETTLLFWQAIANNDLATAKKYASADSQSLLKSPVEKKLENATFSVEEIVINDAQARVGTQARLSSDENTSFTTFLVKEEQHWTVDYQRTQNSFPGGMFNGLFKSLQNIGDNLNKQLEQQIPLIEKEVDSFGQELKKELDKLGQDLENALPPPQKQRDLYQDSI